MSIISLILILAFIGLAMWLVNTYIPMASPFKQILNVVVIILVLLWLLSIFGVLSEFSAAHVPKVR